MNTLEIGIVIGNDPPKHSVIVAFPNSLQPIGMSVQVLKTTADGVRIHQTELPGIGTWGLIAFPYGSDINGIWLGAYYPSQSTAITSTDTFPDAFITYHSHFNNIYSLMDGNANVLWSHPSTLTGDGTGTWLAIGSSSNKPPVYQYVVDAKTQELKRQQFTDAEHLPAVPAPYVHAHHPSGLDFLADPSGNLTLATNTATVTATGNISVSANSTGVLTLAVGTTASIKISSTGITLTFGTNSVILDSTGVTIDGILFDTHIHGGVTSGTDVTLIPQTGP
ncbi:MAG: hypothetical protein ACYCOU_12065 [Sulfobacillus sp.]